MTTKQYRRAVRNRDKKKAYNQFSDFSSEYPNEVKVLDKYIGTGNVCLGTATNAKVWKPWRFGKHPYLLHPITVITIGKDKNIYLNTYLICKYLRLNKNNLREIESAGFKGLKTKAYLVNIKELEDFCKNESLSVAS